MPGSLHSLRARSTGDAIPFIPRENAVIIKTDSRKNNYLRVATIKSGETPALTRLLYDCSQPVEQALFELLSGPN
jgi:hypothetical protein